MIPGGALTKVKSEIVNREGFLKVSPPPKLTWRAVMFKSRSLRESTLYVKVPVGCGNDKVWMERRIIVRIRYDLLVFIFQWISLVIFEFTATLS
jgi:hypothetical protein